MADATYAMTKVLDCGLRGTACGRSLSGRPAAGKTGTNGAQGGNLDAWFVGFTPQLSTAVWYGNAHRKKPVTVNGGELFGGNLPALTWQAMMNNALSGQPVEAFPPPAHVGTNQGSASPLPSKTSPSPSETPSESPSNGPSVSPPPVLPTSQSPPPSPTPTPTQSSPPPAPAESPNQG